MGEKIFRFGPAAFGVPFIKAGGWMATRFRTSEVLNIGFSCAVSERALYITPLPSHFGNPQIMEAARISLPPFVNHECGIRRKYFSRFILQGQAAAADECFQFRVVGIDFKAAAHKSIQ